MKNQLEARTTYVFGDERTVVKLPRCEFPHEDRPSQEHVLARYDARTVEGPWRMMCRRHMKEHGVGVGLNLGQRLWLPNEKHAQGEIPIKELPPARLEFQPKTEPCGECGNGWFLHVMGWRDFVAYCPLCTRNLPDRENGPFTFGDVLAVEYPEIGLYLGKVDLFPCEGAIRCQFMYEAEPPTWSQLFRDGMETWHDVDDGISGLTVRLASPAESREYIRRRNVYRGSMTTSSKNQLLFDMAG